MFPQNQISDCDFIRNAIAAASGDDSFRSEEFFEFLKLNNGFSLGFFDFKYLIIAEDKSVFEKYYHATKGDAGFDVERRALFLCDFSQKQHGDLLKEFLKSVVYVK